MCVTPASAAWHKAESDRFVIYSDSRSSDIEEFAQMLERYHVAMTLESGREVAVPSPSSRLTVYMTGSLEELRVIYGSRRSSVGGFYIPRASGSVSFVPNVRIRAKDNSRVKTGSRMSRDLSVRGIDRSLSILLHEYAHHFLIGSSRHAMPRWLSEGAAEYFSSARFNNDGSVDIGLPNNQRAWEISQAASVPVRELLDYDLYRKNRGSRYDAFYGRSWLLYHYLRFSPERSGQLSRYWREVATGTKSIDAAEKIFGDLDALEKDLKSYGRQRKMAGMRFNKSDISIGAVNVAKLSAGHADMMDVIMRSKRGIDEDDAAKLAEKARNVAAKYSADPAVLSALAEAEFDAGNDAAAIAAADRAIAADKLAKNAYVQKGLALFRLARNAEKGSKTAAFAKAMKPFQALNALEADHTQPLIHYYRSFTGRGAIPPEGARAALERATQLAPFDKSLAVEVAAMKMAEGDPVIARYLLAPVAADPHGQKQAALAQAVIDYLKTAPDGKPVNFNKLKKQIEALGSDASDESAE
ncbi:MAG: DUF1570 domain-containing protein [Marinomonas sp.]